MITNIRVIHTVNDGVIGVPPGTSISHLRVHLDDVFNVPSNAVQFVNGRPAERNRRLLDGDTLEFFVVSGRKGGDLPLSAYGTIDITDGVPKGLVHVDRPRLGPTCKRLGIEFGKALVGWSEFGRRRNRSRYPQLSGVVIRAEDRSRLHSAMEELEKKRKKKVDRLPVLAALFTLNRRAKRCRDSAQAYYQNGMHGLAGEMRREKERIYDLKGQVLHHLVQSGVLIGGKYHKFEFGNYAEILEGGGYRFHRPCPPPESGEAVEIESMEAKPKAASEPTLAVAFEAVKRFLDGKQRATTYRWPPAARLRNRRALDSADSEDDDDDFDGECND